jgi:Flp pilus assembly protein TadG
MPSRRACEQGGAEVIGVVLLAPVVVAVTVVVFFLGRQVDSRAAVRSAAETGAQAAARQRNPTTAATAARNTVTAMLTDHGTCANPPTVNIDVSEFRPGGLVTVDVTCTTNGEDLSAVGGPTRSFTGHATAVIDTYRATGNP